MFSKIVGRKYVKIHKTQIAMKTKGAITSYEPTYDF